MKGHQEINIDMEKDLVNRFISSYCLTDLKNGKIIPTVFEKHLWWAFQKNNNGKKGREKSLISRKEFFAIIMELLPKVVRVNVYKKPRKGRPIFYYQNISLKEGTL